MITSLSLKNFKPFKEQSLAFRPLTLLSGLNSSGKSSVLQALMLLRQSYQQKLLEKTGLALNGELVNIGTAKDVFFDGASKGDQISFELVLENETNGIWSFNYDSEVDVLNRTSPAVDSVVYESNLFRDNFHYLQAERIGPRTFFPMSDFQVRQLGKLGISGEYAAHFLWVNQEKPILNSRLSHPKVKLLQRGLEDPKTPSRVLIDQVEAWMGEISPGTKIMLEPKPDIDLISIKYFYGDGNPYRATNVGFGISYTLPIIVAVLASTPGTLILIENPEAHLHPKGQSKMGELFALAASCGVQIVIETHSDHVLNGIRLAVHSGKLHHKDVQLHYFSREEENGQVVTQVISPRMDGDGRIDTWPEGFFDQAEKDLMELL